MSNIHQTAILALDLGEKRVGVAVSHGVVASPLGFLDFDKKTSFFLSLKKIVEEQKIELIVLGLPLNKMGEDTKQSLWVRTWAKEIATETHLPIVFTEESYSSHEAREMLGVAKSKGEIDAYSAVSILERYLKEGEYESQTI